MDSSLLRICSEQHVSDFYQSLAALATPRYQNKLVLCIISYRRRFHAKLYQ